VGFVERCRIYYKGEGGGFPQVWAMVSLVCQCCPWLVLAPKVFQLHTNHLVKRCKVYYKGEGGGFPQVWTVVNLMCPCCSWFVLIPKVLQLCINHLVWVLCRPVWVSEACQLFLVPSQSSSTPLYPSKCYELRNVPYSSFFRYFLLGLTFESFKELGVRHRLSLTLTRTLLKLLSTTWCIE